MEASFAFANATQKYQFRAKTLKQSHIHCAWELCQKILFTANNMKKWD